MTPVAAQPGYTIKIDGRTVKTSYFTQNGSLMVPAIFFKNAGINVVWDEKYQAVRLTGGYARLSFPAEMKEAYYWTGEDWKKEQLSTKTTNAQGRTFIPLRYAFEKLGLEIAFHSSTSTISISTGRNAVFPSDGVHWLYQLTEAEAGGESYQGKVAVAATVLNRVGHPDWPGTLKEVIFQTVVINGIEYYQYSPVLDGRIYDVKPTKDTIKAVNEALNGKDPTDEAVVFYNPDKTDNKWVRNRPVSVAIGNHIFSK